MDLMCLFLNLCSGRWFKPNLNIANISIPNGSLTLKIFLSTGLINFKNALQNISNLLEPRMFGSSLFHLLMINGKWKNGILKCIVLQRNALKVLGCL